MVKIKLMPEYNCYSTWRSIDNSIFENVAPSELNLSPILIKKLDDWELTYEETFNPDNPATSGFKSSMDEQNFENLGVVLWEQVISELPDVEVIYFSHKNRQAYNWSDFEKHSGD